MINYLPLFTQKRLCAFFIDKSTSKPISAIPVYAELVISVKPDGYKLDLKSVQWIQKALLGKHLTQEQITRVSSLLEAYIGQTYGDPSPEELKLIIEQMLKAFTDGSGPAANKFDDSFINQIIAEVFLSLIAASAIRPSHLQQNQDTILAVPFGFLATDHVGYLSYDIEDRIRLYQEQLAGKDISVSYLMYPYGKKELLVDISLTGKNTSDYIFANVEFATYLVKIKSSYQSLQNPGMIDWYLSPSSFSINPQFFLGEGGCENLYPANFATSEFRFQQIVRGRELQEDPAIRAGFAYEYNASWQPLGHTLGQIIYSLPLAPGEVIKIGVIDWQRESTDSRQEDTSENEALTHDTLRDRTISETVEASLNEWQRGSSFMAGDSGGAGVSYGTGAFGATASNTHSFGGGYSTSSGDRDFTVSTVQQVNDAFSQHSSAIRELRSTIVVQSDQKEYARAETRVVANNNHSHALTMLYYEVLRHYKVTTRFVRRRNVLLIKYSSIDFQYPEIWKYKQILSSSLKDQSLKGGFDVIERFMDLLITENNKPNPVNPADYVFSTLNVTISSGTNGGNGDVRIDCLLHDNTLINILYPYSQDDDDKTKLDTPDNDYEANTSNHLTNLIFRDNRSVKWGDISQFIVSYRGSGTRPTWSLAQVLVTAPSPYGEIELVNSYVGFNFHLSKPNEPAKNANDYGDRAPFHINVKPPVAPPDKNDEVTAYFELSDPERAISEKLKKHLLFNADYYSRIIWLNEDPNDRATWMGNIEFDNGKLIDKIENRAIDVLGNYVVFPSNYGEQNFSAEDKAIYQTLKAKTESLMTLPTRGVFGEARLGHCNASEIIDNTRFWDWQQSPILEQAPDINPIDTSSRNVTQDLTPTPFPSSIVNIVNPSPAPDPTGMAGALTLLGKSDVFRDMSMSSEVTDLLKGLSDNSVDMAQAANQARNILQKQDQKTTQGSSNSTGGTTDSGQSSAQASTPTAQEQESKEIDNSQKKLQVAKANLTPAQQEKVRDKVTKDLTTDDKYIYITLKTADGGGMVNVLEPADYDINNEYQGKLPFYDGLASAKTKLEHGNFHIKLAGKLPGFEGREYLSKIPGFESQHSVFYYNTACYFEFPQGKNSIPLKGTVTIKPTTLELFVDVHGNVTSSAEGGANFALPADIVSGHVTGKTEVEIGGQAGSKITFQIDTITGMTLKQE